MIPKEKQAAHMLEGKTLADGWKVIKKIEKELHNTGGVYSCCYEVENEGRKGFLKAFDLSAADKVGVEAADQIQNILSAFKFEREILKKCSDHRCKNVIELISYGDLEVKEAEKYPRVDYLILEYAENGDIRDVIEEDKATLKWKFKSLHQLAKGLSEIHNLSIAHQDIKPSNVVALENEVTKITDFGSAISLNDDGKNLPDHLKKDYSGSWEYAPPELLYGYISGDPIVRRIGCDLYLLGSMIAYYFTDLSMTALIRSNLQDTLSWTNPATYGKYEELKTYIVLAFENSLEDIRRRIPVEKIQDQIILIIKYLCHPDPTLRGHERNIKQLGPNYGLNRFITMFDVMYRYYKFR